MIPESPLPFHAAVLAGLSQSGRVALHTPKQAAGESMARILMAWELGAGYGHMAPLVALARPLMQAGHHVSFAARDTTVAEAVLAGSSMPWHPAPANRAVGGPWTLHSYPQILMRTAFNETQALQERLQAWRRLYDETRPDILVSDHSPTALLAARGRDLRCIATGTGFVVPPDLAPMPELRPWEPLDPAELARDEAQVLDTVNAAVRAIGIPPLSRLGELHAAAAPALFTLKELDPYAEVRGAAGYWGPIPAPPGEAPRWPEGDGKRVFLYGQPFESLVPVLERLRESPHRTLVYIQKLAPELRQRLQGPRLRFAERLQDMAAVTRDCDCAVMTNGHGTTAAMLLAGKPVLLLPQHLEMLLLARSVERAGLGLAAPLLRLEGILGKLERLLAEESFTLKAREFAGRHRDRLDAASPGRHFQALVTRLADGR